MDTMYTNIHRIHIIYSLAAEEGFEPSQIDPESIVLPLHNSAIFMA